MGGIPLFLGTAFALLIWLPQEASLEHKYLFGALSIVFVIGLRDDLIPLRPIFKLLSQLIPALIVIYLSDIRLDSFYDLFDWQFPKVLTWTITVFVIIVITNSINLIDGLDGLAGSISFIILGSIAVWFYLIGDVYFSYITFAFLGGIAAFLYFNWQPSKIFMGDTGALLMGFFQACIIILFINKNYDLPYTSHFKFMSSIGTAICIMIIPLMDTLRVFIIRIVKAKSPFEADNNHIHHLLIKAGLNHSQSVMILICINAVFIALAILLKEYGDLVLLTTALLLSLIFIGVIYKASKAKAQKA